MEKVNGKIIFKAIVGSQSYGTNVEGSDIDIKGVYVQDHMEILTYGYKEQVEITKDEVYYEVRRFLELLESANPTVLELLYSPKDCILVIEPEFQMIMDHREKFLTKKCKHSFGGYAVQQIKKARGLNKKMNWEKGEMVRKTPLDFCYIYKDGGSIPLETFLKTNNMKQELCGLVNVDHIKDGYALYYDILHHIDSEIPPIGLKGIILEDSNSIRLSSVPIGTKDFGIVSYNKDGYTQHCNAFKEYQTWLKERNTQRYVDIEGHGQQIDGKNMLHCRRLLDMALEIAKTKTLNVRRWNGDYLRSIRQGKVDLNSLLDQAEKDIVGMDEAFAKCHLPDDVDRNLKQELLTKIREYEGISKVGKPV